MYRTTHLAPPLSLLLVVLAGCSPGDVPGQASAVVIQSLDQTIGGPKALARDGDLLIENDHLRVAILGARNCMGPGLYGGVIIDADLQWYTPETLHGNGRDQFGELDPTVSLNVVHPQEGDVFVVSDGADGGPAVIRAQGKTEPFLSILGGLWSMVGTPEMHMVTDYIAEPEVPWLTLRSTVTVEYEESGLTELPLEGEPLDYSDDGLALIDLAIESGLIMGEYYLPGNSVDVFAPGLGFDEESDVAAAWEDGRDTFADPFQFPLMVGVGHGVSYGLASSEGDLYVPLFLSGMTVAVGGGKAGAEEGERFEAGSSYTYERYFFVGHGDVGSIMDQYLQAREISAGSVGGVVVDATTGEGLSGVQVFAFEPGAERPWNQWESDVDPRDEMDDGSWGGMLPVGDWEIMAHRHGRPDTERIPITVTEGGEVPLRLALQRSAVVDFFTWDESGQALPAKITVTRIDGQAWRDPVLGDGFIAGQPELVLFPAHGHVQAELAPGRYQALASRGVEYEWDAVELEVGLNEQLRVDLAVHRSVDSAGWIAADFHVHHAVSHDSGISSEARVASMACEGVEFFVSTDHDYIWDHSPTVETMDMERWLKTAGGVEVTTLELGHYIGWPLTQDTLADSGGAFDWTGMEPQDIISDLRQAGKRGGYRPLVQVPHPRSGILGYFDQYGYDPDMGVPGVAGEPGTLFNMPGAMTLFNPVIQGSSRMSMDMDAVEVINGKSLRYIRTPTQSELDAFAAGEDITPFDILVRTAEEQEAFILGEDGFGYGHRGQIEDWFTLLNMGYRTTALANSDSHGATSIESGCPRNYVLSETDDPAYIDPQAVADAVRDHQVVATYGPLVTLQVDGQPIGSEVIPSGEEVEIEVAVQAPTWMDIDRVQLYENGQLIREWLVPGGQRAADRFHEAVLLVPKQDSWYVAMAVGEDSMEPMFTPVELPEVEMQVIVAGALSGVDAVSALLPPPVDIPRTHPIHPFGLTNPIWVDLDGDGFDAPGLPDWWSAPVEPEQ